MAAKTAVEVAEMESELYLLRSERAQFETRIALLTQERDACKVELAIASARAREEMMKSTQLETIISQTSMGLVSALRSYHAQKTAERSARMAAQERELGVGDEDTVSFLQRRQDQREAADDAAAQHPMVDLAEEVQVRTQSTDRAFMRGARLDAQDRVLETKMTGRAPEPRAEDLRAAAEAIHPPLPLHLQPVKDHPLLPPLGEIPREPPAIRRPGDLRSMMQRTQER